jgi:hypothetical protein
MASEFALGLDIHMTFFQNGWQNTQTHSVVFSHQDYREILRGKRFVGRVSPRSETQICKQRNI